MLFLLAQKKINAGQGEFYENNDEGCGDFLTHPLFRDLRLSIAVSFALQSCFLWTNRNKGRFLLLLPRINFAEKTTSAPLLSVGLFFILIGI